MINTSMIIIIYLLPKSVHQYNNNKLLIMKSRFKNIKHKTTRTENNVFFVTREVNNVENYVKTFLT